MANFFMSLLIKGFSLVMALVLLISPGVQPSGDAIEPTDADSLRLSFSVLSDVHMESNTMQRFQVLRASLKDIEQAAVDASIFLGDNTMNGQIAEYMMFYGILSRNNAAKNTLVAMGNHDINDSKNSMEQALKKHNAFYNGYTGEKNDKTYYYQVIDGYYFIVMGSEDKDYGTAAYISPDQIAWLDATLALAAKEEKPIFLFNHQPFYDKLLDANGDDLTFKEEYIWSMKDTSEAVFDVVKKYNNVIFFSGHLHFPLSRTNVTVADGVTMVNVPNFGNMNPAKGLGFYVEVYSDQVILRARAFALGEWEKDYVFPIDLV